MAFSDWLEEIVRGMGMRGEVVSADLGTLSRLPSPWVKHHNSMWAYGYHFRTEAEDGRNNVSFDAGVAAIISQTCQSSRADMNPVEADLQYVGILNDLLTVDYGHLKFNVLKCSWIKSDLQGNPCIRRDIDGFWLVKHAARLNPAVEPYLMPIHARQVSLLRTLRP